jgi:flagellar biosynthesis protein FlhG
LTASVASASPPTPRPRLLAIASGKGGVGKTWLATTLSRALVQTGHSVMLFDGDLGLANVDIQLGLMPEHDLTAVIAGRRSVADSAVPYPAGGFSVLAGRSGSGALATLEPEALERLLSLLATETSVSDVVIDLGAGLDRAVRRMATVANTLLVVATEEPTSLTDAYAVLKLYAADQGSDARVIVNQAATPAAGVRTFATIARACTSFLGSTPAQAGIVRRDDHVRDAVRRQALLLTRHPSTAAAVDVQACAQGLLHEIGMAVLRVPAAG